ncbi:hypothetical protein LTR62_000256 [Meristemomyces frigidus]|uniref:Translation initiation factor 3 N-terminal domain-containing protein n=1 Tax=Meristemomyces frigidus TaxID=1508187 RepID=A0AAN7TK94_9PEZI|nr:hypothetical protein LTR62_000256 [Meristemomyces frigidus]
MHLLRHSVGARQALYHVFVQPALLSSQSTQGGLQHITKQLSQLCRTRRHPQLRCFSQSAARLSKTREPEKRNQKWDEEITARVIQLLDPETNQLPRDPETNEITNITHTRYDILKALDRNTHRLIQLTPDEPGNRNFIPLCKIVSKKEMFDAEKKRKVQSKERQKESAKANTVKTLELNWAIDANDLSHRLEKVEGFLGEGRRVEIVLAAKKRGRKATQLECDGVLSKIQGTLAAVPGAKELRPLDGKVGGFATIVLQGSVIAGQLAQAGKGGGG